MASIRKIDKCWEHSEPSQASYFLSGVTNGGPALGNGLTIPPKVKHESYHMTLQMKTYIHTKMDMFLAAFFITDRKWKHKGPLVTDRQM